MRQPCSAAEHMDARYSAVPCRCDLKVRWRRGRQLARVLALSVLGVLGGAAFILLGLLTVASLWLLFWVGVFLVGGGW